MRERELAIVPTVGLVYRDLIRVACTMPGLMLIALVVLFAINAADFLFTPYFDDRPLALFFKETGTRLVESLLLTPLLIAAHRLIVLGQATARYALDVRSTRFERYFAWSVLLWIMTISVGLIARLLTAAGLPPGLSIGTMLGGALAAAIVSLRLTLLFPAIAVDAPGASARNAFADTGGFLIGILFVFVLTMIPVVCVFLAAGLVIGWFNVSDVPIGTIGSLALAAAVAPLQAAIYVLLAALSSRVYQALAERVHRAQAA